MKVIAQDKKAFKFICNKLKKMGYKTHDIKIYMLSMSFFLALDAQFIKEHKLILDKLFNSVFERFTDTSAFFVFGIKNDIENIGKEITDDFLKECEKTSNQIVDELDNALIDLNVSIIKNIYKFQKLQIHYSVSNETIYSDVYYMTPYSNIHQLGGVNEKQYRVRLV